VTKPHAASLRKGRVSLSNQVYALTAVTHDRNPHFSNFWSGRILVNAMRSHEEKGDVETLAFVIMPDHLHWLISLTGSSELSDLMRSVKGFTARCLHGYRVKNAAPTGNSSSNFLTFRQAEQPIWQAGFHDHALRRDEDVRTVARYIVMNPVRSKIVSSIWEYPLWDAVWVE
jgi:putative transposase